MALEVLITNTNYAGAPFAREFIGNLQRNSTKLNLDDAVLYYDFPAYADYETVTHKPDALILSPYYGIFAIRFASEPTLSSLVETLDESLSQFCSILFGRLLKSKILRKDLSSLILPITPVIQVYDVSGRSMPESEVEYSRIITSIGGFEAYLSEAKIVDLDPTAFGEMRSVVEGAKALTRPQKRNVERPETQKSAAALAKLEAEIANFDQQQRRAALVTVPGPQRIRGLAGSGKTVILAMKAAHLHLNNPENLILVTFFTRSLRASLQNLITRFYRHYKDEDPDWSKIHIRHGWGGASVPGVYSDTCRRHGLTPTTFSAAQKASPQDPFDFICRALLSRVRIENYYDHILIDEGQDFPSGFYELCFSLAKGSRDQKNIVWAYDELQTILNVKIRSPNELFGKDDDKEPRISLERAGQGLPQGAVNDTVLSKCYRNQREVLVAAHAIGFGIYGEIVQLLESREHWQDVGYEVVSEGEFKVGAKIHITRPAENSPISLDVNNGPKLIRHKVKSDFRGEVSWVTRHIKRFLEGGLAPEDILVIAMDDRNARLYLQVISGELAEADIQSNNLLADPYNEPPFWIPGKVTLSTVYRAKGNEASVVFAVGVDAINTSTRVGRNKLFTAFTRTKAWLRVSGVGESAARICGEIDRALTKFPDLEFVMPDLKTIETIQRDISKKAARANKIRAEYIQRLKKEGFNQEEIADLLMVETKE